MVLMDETLAAARKKANRGGLWAAALTSAGFVIMVGLSMGKKSVSMDIAILPAVVLMLVGVVHWRIQLEAWQVLARRHRANLRKSAPNMPAGVWGESRWPKARAVVRGFATSALWVSAVFVGGVSFGALLGKAWAPGIVCALLFVAIGIAVWMLVKRWPQPARRPVHPHDLTQTWQWWP